MPTAKRFPGFGDSEVSTSIPDSLFAALLPGISDLPELKIVLYAVWRVQHMDSRLKALASEDFSEVELGLKAAQISAGLEKAVADGILLLAGSGPTAKYLLNSPGGRAAAEAIAGGTGQDDGGISSTPMERPNVFGLYEQNIGPLTPLIADALKDAEESYPPEWISEAIELAVRNNKRSWSYCEAILRRWKEEGRGTKQNRPDDQAARQRDVEEKIRKFIRG
jgi:DNA replication protein